MSSEPVQPRPSKLWILAFSLPCLFIAITDLWSKAAVFAHTQTYVVKGRPLVEATTDFTWWIIPAWNTGVAWSMFEDNPIFIAILTATLIPILIFTYFRWYRNQHLVVDIAFGAVIGGAVANAYDRFMTHFSNDIHGVRDFLAFTIPVIDYRWPTFNIADAGISCGFVVLLIASFIQERRISQAKLLENKPAPSDESADAAHD